MNDIPFTHIVPQSELFAPLSEDAKDLLDILMEPWLKAKATLAAPLNAVVHWSEFTMLIEGAASKRPHDHDPILEELRALAAELPDDCWVIID